MGLRRALYSSRGDLNNRLLDIAEDKVTFRYKDYRHDAQHRTMTLEAEEFIRRFLLHLLPEGFQRIRYYGFLANRYREQKTGALSRASRHAGAGTTGPRRGSVASL
jgi:Putative transposase